MDSGALRRLDANLYRRGRLVTSFARWISLGIGLIALAALWSGSQTRPLAGLAIAAGYAAFTLGVALATRGEGGGRALKTLHNVVDALALGAGAAVSGALASPIWLLFYPHVVAVSVRGGLRYALAFGMLDAALVSALALATPEQPAGLLHGLAVLWCAFVAGTTSSYLKQVRLRLTEVNAQLHAKNEELSSMVAESEASRQEQEQTLARLSESEERYRRLLERLQDGVLILQEGRVSWANEVFAAMVGEPREALAGRDIRELVPGKERGALAERYKGWTEAKASSGSFETRLETRNGQPLLVSVRAGSAEVEGRRSVIATVRDITRERRMEAEVKAHAQRLAAINDIAGAVNRSLTRHDIVSATAEEARRIVPFDRLSLAVIGESADQVEVVALEPGAAPAPLAREDVAWAFRRPWSWCQGAEEPRPGHLERLCAEPDLAAAATVPLHAKDGVIGSMNLARLKPVAFSTWDLAVMEPVARHIASALDNARLLEAVRRRGREFESLLGIGRAILGRLNLSEILPLVARNVNEIMGTHICVLLLRSGEELAVAASEGLEPEVVESFRGLRVGESLSGWVALHGQPLAIEDMREDQRLKFTDVVVRFGYRSFLCVPLRRGSETLGTLEVVTKDVARRFGATEQELMSAFADQAAIAIDNARLFEETRAHLDQMAEANRRLEELDRLREEYLRNVSHEFRTPLTVIRGYAEYLRDAGAPEARALGEVMHTIIESCDRVIDMVDTLLEVSRIEHAGAARTLQVQELELGELTASSVEPLRPSAEKKHVALELDFPQAPLRLQGDAGLLHQLLRKLLDNAVKYSRQGGRVVVRGREDGQLLLLEVEDSGIGIAAEHLPRIFEKFYMVDGGIARRVGGTGVGLYLVREIVRLHGGDVGVRSEPGRGSLFSVRLPRVFRREQQAVPA